MSRAFITGASSGIGMATAEALAAKGFDLLLTARRVDRLGDLAQAIARSSKADVAWAGLDVRDRASVDAFAREHEDLLRESVLLVNSAGLALGTEKLPEGSPDDWDQVIDTNVKGLLYVTRVVLPHMIAAGRGHVINLGSAAGRWVYPGGAIYCASKFAVRALSEGLRMDLLGTPIRVTNIEPGMVETEFSEVRLRSKERAKTVYHGMKPLGAADIAECVVWCALRPSHVNIQELVIFPTDQAAIQMVSRQSP